MKTPQPSRLAVALLNHFVADNEPLIGDLFEEFRTRQSQVWFWRQVLVAILISSRQDVREIRPLKLQEVDSSLDFTRPPNLSRRINLSGSPVEGIGGLGLVALGVLVTIVLPQAWWAVLGAVLGGIILGVIMIIISRRRVTTQTRPTRVLFG
jgi:hypothetical protein